MFHRVISNKWSYHVTTPTPPSRITSIPQSKPSKTESSIDEWLSGKVGHYHMTILGHLDQPFPLICNIDDAPIDAQIVDAIEEAQLKGLIPVEAQSHISTIPGRLGSQASAQATTPAPWSCDIALSLHGLKLTRTDSGEVQIREPLHSLLSAVSFQGDQKSYVGIAIEPKIGSVPISTTSFEGDVVYITCFAFLASSSEEAVSLVSDIRQIFSAALKAPETMESSL